MAGLLKNKLMKELIDSKVITREQLDKALQIQKERGGKLSDILISENFISREELIAVLGHQYNAPPIKLSRYKIDPEVLQLMPKKLVKQYRIVPVSKIGGMLTVAMTDPLNVFAIDDIASLTGYKIRTLITTDKEIEDAINEYYEVDAEHVIEDLIDEVGDEGGLGVLDLKLDEGVDSSDLIKLVQEAPVVKITNLILSEGVKAGASDVMVEPQEKSLRIRYRVDGILREAREQPKSLQHAIISRIKVMANLNIAERRLPQDGRFMLKLRNREVDFRVSILPGSYGEKAALRILDKSTAMLDLDTLGFAEKPLGVLKQLSKRPHGMILVCGPTGCGKTTTLYSVLKFVDNPTTNIVTVEDPVEFQLKGINQVTIRPNIGLTFPSSLRSILRQDPDIIMVGEIRDFDTVDIAIKAALTGHLVLSTLHTTTASGSIVRLLNMGVEPFLISSSIILVAAQRLVRKICPHCKEPYKADERMAKRLNLDTKKKFYRGKGCKECLNTGYKGRSGLIEVLPLTTKVRELVCRKAKEFEIKDAARKEGMMTLRENGLAAVDQGITTVEEVVRVTVGDQEIAVK
jgi:type IV pilus assembly protein PilB